MSAVMEHRRTKPCAPVVHARQHIIYDYMLRCYLLLKEEDRQALKRVHQFSDEQIDSMLWRSAPAYVTKLIIEQDFARDFDLRGIAGFYTDERGHWLLNLNASNSGELAAAKDNRDFKDKLGSSAGLLLPYFQNNLIVGLMVYRSAYDRAPRPLTSANKVQGSRAIPPPKQ
jgi:hypothetical protein